MTAAVVGLDKYYVVSVASRLAMSCPAALLYERRESLKYVRTMSKNDRADVNLSVGSTRRVPGTFLAQYIH